MLKTLSGSLREYKKSSLAAIFFSGIEVIFEIVIPLCMSNLIDSGIEKSNISMVWKFGILLLFFALLQLATGMLSAYTAAKAATGFSANLRQDMYDNMQTFAFSNIDRFSTASIVTRLTTDVTNVQNAYQMLIKLAVRGPVILIVSMIVSFRINRQISLIFHREDLEISKFKKISQDIYKGFAKAEQMLALNSPLMQICMYTCMILTSWIGAKAIVASSSAGRIAKILQGKTDIANPENPVMHVADGETLGIIGGTGSSKSSLVQLIPRLYDVTSGSLTLGGVDVRMNLSMPCRRVTKPILNRAAPMFPAVRSSVSVLPGHCLRNPGC